MKTKAFTLIELLITTALFVAVAILATGALTTTLSAQQLTKQSQTTDQQLQFIQSTLTDDITGALTVVDVNGNVIGSRSFYVDGLVTLQLDQVQIGAYPNDAMLILVEPTHDVYGQPQVAAEKHAYCAEQVLDSSGQPTGGKRLVRYTISPSTQAIIPAFLANAGRSCTQTYLNTLFGFSGGTIIPKIYLTDPTLDILNFRLWPEWFNNGKFATQFYDLDPPGVLIEVTAQYNIDNSDTTKEGRANQGGATTKATSGSSPVTIRFMVARGI